jgi:hypothetical protein
MPFSGRKPGWPPFILAAIAVGFYFLLFFTFAVDIPFGDDYAVLAFVLNVTNPNWPAKAAYFFSQHNEHRIVTLRAVVFAFYAITHRFNFVFIMLLGNLGLLGIASMFYRFMISRKEVRAGPERMTVHPLFAVLPVFFLLFQPQHREITFWAMVSFTHVYAVLFALLSFYFLIRGKDAKSFAAAIAFSALAAFTNGNGVFVFPIGILALILMKKFSRLLLWILSGAIYIGFYFLHYARNPAHPEPFASLAKSILADVQYFLSILGSAFNFGLAPATVTMVAGILLILGLLYALKRHILKTDLFLSSLAAFILLSLAAVTLTRIGLGVGQSYSPRYKLLSALMLAILYLAFLGRSARKKTVVLCGIVFSLVFCVFSYARNFTSVRDYRNVLAMNLSEWDAGKADLPYPNQEHAEIILRQAAERNIYEPPAFLNIQRIRAPFGAVTKKVEASEEGRKEVIFSGWALDGGGCPSIIVRREPLASDPRSSINRQGLVFVGKGKFKEESVPGIARIYYGFPGTDRMVWEFRLEPGEIPVGGEITLHFFVRDRVGLETLLGTNTVSEARKDR